MEAAPPAAGYKGAPPARRLRERAWAPFSAPILTLTLAERLALVAATPGVLPPGADAQPPAALAYALGAVAVGYTLGEWQAADMARPAPPAARLWCTCTPAACGRCRLRGRRVVGSSHGAVWACFDRQVTWRCACCRSDGHHHLCCEFLYLQTAYARHQVMIQICSLPGFSGIKARWTMHA